MFLKISSIEFWLLWILGEKELPGWIHLENSTHWTFS